MDLCLVLALYSAMATTHMDIQANHAKINEGGRFLESKCSEHKENEEKKAEKKTKTGESKIEKN